MCPSLAEPDSDGFSKSSVSNYEPQANKSFLIQQFFQKCWRGVGEQPTFAKQIIFEIWFPISSRRRIKSFLIQQFFKNVGEVQGE